ncbi:MAG: DUF4345 family protein [Phycicoccus sp.]
MLRSVDVTGAHLVNGSVDTSVILTIGAAFLAMGCYALATPAALIRPFGLVVDSPESRSEIRAVYGGFGVAVSAVLAVAAADPGGLRPGITTAVGAALAGMAAGRVASRLRDRPTAFYPIWFYFWVEAVGALILLAVA